MKPASWKKIKTGTLLLITWYDIVEKSSWSSDEDAQNMPPATCKTIGWFVNDDDICIRLTASVADDGDKSIFVYPKGCVKDVQIIKYRRQR